MVLEWSAASSLVALGRRCEHEHSSYLVEHLLLQEVEQRSLLNDCETFDSQNLWVKETIDDESAARRQLEVLLLWHELMVSEICGRSRIVQTEVDEKFASGFGSIFAELTVARLDVEIAEVTNRAVMDKSIIFDHFLLYQRIFIMEEFVVRGETISRVLSIARVERRERFALESHLRGETLPHSGSTVSPRDTREATSLGLSGGSCLRPNLFAKDSAIFTTAKGSRLAPLPGAPLIAKAAWGHDDASAARGADPTVATTVTGAVNRKKTQKYLASLNAVDDCVLHEALNVRPLSADSSTPPTPRTPTNASHIPMTLCRSKLLNPLRAAAVRFQPLESDEHVRAKKSLEAALNRLRTHEAYQRFLVADAAAKSMTRHAAIFLLEQFEMAVEQWMADAEEAVTADVIEAFSIHQIGVG